MCIRDSSQEGLEPVSTLHPGGQLPDGLRLVPLWFIVSLDGKDVHRLTLIASRSSPHVHRLRFYRRRPGLSRFYPSSRSRILTRTTSNARRKTLSANAARSLIPPSLRKIMSLTADRSSAVACRPSNPLKVAASMRPPERSARTWSVSYTHLRAHET